MLQCLGSSLQIALIFFTCLIVATPLERREEYQKETQTPDWEIYERGDLGVHPQKVFQSSSANVPVIHVSYWHASCDSSSLVLLSPQDSDRIPGNRAWIVDTSGDLIWYHEEWGTIKNLQVQTFKGRQYLTFWVGDDHFYGHGSGFFKMLDQNYKTAYAISAGNGLDGDYHEFSITHDQTALIIAYVKTPFDLLSKGRQDGYIWDCVFQELEIETNRVIFEWRASDHYKIDDMTVDSWSAWTGTEEDPFDWFHLNSVEKDRQGNFLLASRYMGAVFLVSNETGETLWTVGGELGNFIDLAEGNATKIVDPQMARWGNNGTAITLFDNVAFWSYEKKEKQSHAIKLDLNMETRIVKVNTEFLHPAKILARTGGSIHQLDNGHWLVGYGSTPVASEFSSEGEFLCDTHYGPLNAPHEAGSDGVPREAYRVFKQAWAGFPEEAPKVRIVEQQMFVTWNGATEVRSWKLEGRNWSRRKWSPLGTVDKFHFETAISVHDDSLLEFQLTALDEDEEVLGAWFLERDGRLAVSRLYPMYRWQLIQFKAMYTEPIQKDRNSYMRSLGWATLCTSFLLLIILNRRTLLVR